MKIEKINDRQIRCTLTREDLANREIKLSELAYGSEKATELFHDMMQIAADDFGFEADNAPIMIEAIPMSMDAILLIITKVDDPEELDTRFSRFSPENASGDLASPLASLKEKLEGADDILGAIQKISEAAKRSRQKSNSDSNENTDTTNAAVPNDETEDNEAVRTLTKFYAFRTLDDAISASAILGALYDGPNTLFKNPQSGEYYLLITKAENSAEQFNKACNILSEYAMSCKYAPGMDAHFTEHMEVILADNALQTLARLS